MKRLFLMVAVFLLMAVSAYGGVWYPQGTVLNYTLGTTYGVAEPFVLYEGNPQILTGVTNIFKMWYTLGNAARGVGYAESLDGKTWIQYGGNPVIANEVRPQIIKIGATYYCYALTDQFTSSDGINWSLAHSAVIPVGGVGTWDHTGIARTVVWIEGATWYCLYEGTDGSKWQTGLATSSDGITWSKDAGNPVLINPKTSSGSASGTWITKQGSTYFLFSHDTPGAGVLPTDIYCYSSTDLHAWTRTSVVAALPRNAVDEGPYIAGQVESANLVEANGFTYLFYGANATDSSKNIIKLAIAYMPLSSVLSTVQGLLPPISGGFDFRDEFKTSLTAGNINGTAAEPGPGNRTVADTNNFLSIANGLIFGASTNAAWDNPQIYYPVLSRVPGKSISWKATSPSGASQWE